MAEQGPTLRLRLLSALALVPIALAVVAAGGWIYVLGVALLVTLMAREWRRLSEACFGRRYSRLAGATTLVVGLGATTIAALGRPREAVLCVLIGVTLASVGAWARGAAAMWAGIGVALIGLPAVALVWLRSVPELGLGVLLWLLIVVWTTDTAAYAVGRRVGGPRLAPSISPGKTWSGLGGGVIGASLAGAITLWALGSERLVHAAGLGAAFAVLAQLGDLAESALKRRAGVKDSGSLIPGHGGVLDRVDGFLLTAPVLALLLGSRAWQWP
ncbi:MAG TPA: phosphatidate cytidylyltransferase [Geminicoccaceae bacterium]